MLSERGKESKGKGAAGAKGKRERKPDGKGKQNSVSTKVFNYFSEGWGKQEGEEVARNSVRMIGVGIRQNAGSYYSPPMVCVVGVL